MQQDKKMISQVVAILIVMFLLAVGSVVTVEVKGTTMNANGHSSSIYPGASNNAAAIIIQTGIAMLAETKFQGLQGKRVGILTNPTGVMPNLELAVDYMARHKDEVDIVGIFGPEHGFRGTAQAGSSEGSFIDDRTGIIVYDIYGKSVAKMTDIVRNATVDVILFDIQDVGARFYTYIWSMWGMMQAAANVGGIEFWVLDRPNPLGGILEDGPVLDLKFASGIGRLPIPQMHGMTVGELASLFAAEYLPTTSKLKALKVVQMRGWTRDMTWEKTGLHWIPPSPNMPSPNTAFVYPGTGLFEGTNASEGRGTTLPFEIIGAPFVNYTFAETLRSLNLPGVEFRETYFTPTFSKFQNQVCCGVQIFITDYASFNAINVALHMLSALHKLYPNDFAMTSYLDLLTGTDSVRLALQNDVDVATIETKWKSDLATFASKRTKYLLY